MYPPPRTEESFWLRSSFVPYEERAELFLLTLLDQVRDYQFYTKEGSLGKFMFVFIGNCPIYTNVHIRDLNVLIFLDFSFRYDSVHQMY